MSFVVVLLAFAGWGVLWWRVWADARDRRERDAFKRMAWTFRPGSWPMKVRRSQ